MILIQNEGAEMKNPITIIKTALITSRNYIIALVAILAMALLTSVASPGEEPKRPPDWRDADRSCYAKVDDSGPGGHFNDNPQVVVADDGTWICTWTTGGREASKDMHIVFSVSHDQGVNWSKAKPIEPEHATYQPGGNRQLKNPRANAPVEKFANGKYILCYHNYGGRQFRYPRDLNRNPV